MSTKERKLSDTVKKIMQEFDDDENQELSKEEMKVFITSFLEKSKIDYNEEQVDKWLIKMDVNRDQSYTISELKYKLA